jgi:hypothetical protein
MTSNDEINEIAMCKKDAMVLAHMSALSTQRKIPKNMQKLL